MLKLDEEFALRDIQGRFFHFDDYQRVYTQDPITFTTKKALLDHVNDNTPLYHRSDTFEIMTINTLVADVSKT